MKKLFIITTCSLFLFGCNMKPNKEARIQDLENEMKLTIIKINELESRVQELEGLNDQLKNRIIEFEKR